MESGKFKANIMGGKLEMSYEIGEGQLIEVKAPVGAVVNPFLDQMKLKIESKEIDLIPGTDLDATVLMTAIDFMKKYVG